MCEVNSWCERLIMEVKNRYLFLFTIAVFSPSLAMIPSMEEYFPEMANDLTQIEWMHATNSKKLLEEALANPDIHMIEADIVMGRLEGGGDEIMPIMGHPPANSSDLSLQNFIETIIASQTNGKKGMKLDFKSDEAYNQSWPILTSLYDKLTFPVWINADILHGPVNAQAIPLDPRNFFSKARSFLPDALLSPGWCTSSPLGLGKYNEEHMEEMKNLIQEMAVTQPVTFAVRANFASRSKELILDLVANVSKYQGNDKATVTLWMSSDADIIDIPKLRELIFELGKKRTVLDVPERIRNALNLDTNVSPVRIARDAVVSLLTSITTCINKIL